MSLLAVFLIGLLCGTAHSATITLSAVTSPVTEGADITVQCSIPTMEGRDVAVGLALDTTSTAEDGYDAGFVEFYRCVVAAGATTGTVDIPTFADTVTETTTDTLVITGTAESLLDTVTGTASFVITDDGLGTAPTIRVRTGFYRALENVLSLPVTVELVDANGDAVPFEDADTFGFTFVDGTATGGTTGEAAGDDYDNSVTGNIAASTMGVATIQTTISIPLFDDTFPENVESFSLFLDGTGSTLAVDTTEHFLFIEDNDADACLVEWCLNGFKTWSTYATAVNKYEKDKPELIVLNSYAALPRRSRKTVTQYAFTENDGIRFNDGIVWESGPNVLSDSIVSNIAVAGADGIELNLPRPTSKTRTRFNWYAFRTAETTPAGTFQLLAASLISATNRRGRAPIDVQTGSTVTVCPASINFGETDLGTPVTISVLGGFKSRTLRWAVYRRPGVSIDRRLPANNGQISLTLTKLSDVGVYIIFRRRRRQLGWVQYVNVIPSECPCGTYHAAGICDGGPLECQHGGFVDPSFNEGLCTCPPGYVGRLCEFAVENDQFGSYGQYVVSDFFPGNRFGRGITFSFSYPFGSTCAAGFYGPGCWKRCPDGIFGPGCGWFCNCLDNACTLNGRCLNGCAPGFTGSTCQIPL